MKRALFASVLLISCSLGGLALAGGDPSVKCETGKLKEIGKYFACRTKADAKAKSSGFLPVYTDCKDKFSDKFAGIETKAGAGVCPTEGNYAAVEQCIAEASTACAELLAASVCDQEADCQACATCAVSGDCADEVDACLNDPECSALDQCVANCGDQACFDGCLAAHPDGVPLLQAYSDCIFGECPTTCGP